MNALVIGTLLAIAALSFVLYPLLIGAYPSSTEVPARKLSDTRAVDALREIEFDRATGKLSDADYETLKASYTQAAINAMRSSEASVCENCGYETEAGAKFCSRCGRPL
ncbi:MAG TPA: zinc-ribbon domain-containing protein [Gemmatimonadaceae bacterium]|nr:zinc-ribbon domain-containing protein [Gemmatimonadaceae bacterium]